MVFVANLTTETLSSVAEFDSIYAQVIILDPLTGHCIDLRNSRATNQRSVGATKLNHASSRSHAVLTIEVTMTEGDRSRAIHSLSSIYLTRSPVITGKMNLVDLAGSENNKVYSSVHASARLAHPVRKLTGNDPSRMAESSAINKSLSVLGQVVRDLNLGKARIPYRNSKLTRILQDALGGSSVGLLICNIAPGTKFRKDTLNTLKYVQICRIHLWNKSSFNPTQLRDECKRRGE